MAFLDQLATCLRDQNLGAARAVLDRALTVAPDFFMYHEKLGDLFAQTGQLARAEASYATALRLGPDAAWISVKQRALATQQAAPARQIHLFMPFYTPPDPARAAELLYCLDRNLDCADFSTITLLVDDDTAIVRADPRLRILRLDHRPTYLDWIRASRRTCAGQISVLANSDIHFDAGIGQLRDIFCLDPLAFVALSRFDKTGDTLTPHPNPHFSQDTWAFCPPDAGQPRPAGLDAPFDVPLGVPRCDNKIGYLFSVTGHTVYNPMPFIRSVHVHETGLRYYDKILDQTVLGGMAMLHPGASLTAPARIDIELWAPDIRQYQGIAISKSLPVWAKAAQHMEKQTQTRRKLVLAHDADWQFPAITEQHAFVMLTALRPDDGLDHDSVYLAFPWATLIDLTTHNGKVPRTQALRAALDRLAPQIGRYGRVVTVCQHVHAASFADMFATAGVTDLFWSHTTLGATHFAAAPGVRLHPFALFPVQQIAPADLIPVQNRDLLFSFVGARANAHYLTPVRNMIIDLLQGDPRGTVIDRDNWHYNRVVYDKQILNRPGHDTIQADQDAEAVFRDIMRRSVFSLCPSGTGPNSIRLWEAILSGSIPVVLADTFLPPGDTATWAMATVSCRETPQGIAALPDRLAAIAADPALLAQKAAAVQDLATRYGPARFVTDILQLLPGPGFG